MPDSGRCAACNRAIDSLDQKFCPACGQPTPIRRIDWRFLGEEFEHGVLNMDRGILYTLKQLMLRPGQLVRGYIEGRRTGIVKPVSLLLILAAAVVVTTEYLVGGDVMGSAFFAGAADGMRAGGDPGAARVAEAYSSVHAWMNQHFAATTLLLIPIEAAMLRLSFGRMGRLNYPEWMVITAFLTAQTFVLWGLSLPLHRHYPAMIGWILLASMAYAFFTLVMFFKDQAWWKVLLRTLLGYTMFFVTQSIAMFLVVLWVLATG